MKTLIPLFLVLSAISYANAGVVQSGNWTSADTWGGTVPTESPFTDLSFASSGLSLTVDADKTADRIQQGDNAETNISINSGKTLTISAYAQSESNTNRYYNQMSNSASNILNITGDGTLKLSSTAESRFQRGQVVLDVNVTATSGSFYLLNSGTINASKFTINKLFNATGKQVNFGNWEVEIGSNAIVKGGWTMMGISGQKMTVHTGAQMELSSTRFASLDFDGTMNVSSTRTYQEFFALKLGLSATDVVKLGANASINVASTAARARTIIYSQLTSLAGVGAIKTKNPLFINNGATLNLNSSNAFAINATTQGESVFNIVHFYNDSANSYADTFSLSKANINLGADNNFGSFVFYDGSELTFASNGYNSVIGGVALYGGNSDYAYAINMKNLVDFTVKINSLDNISYTEVGGQKVASDIWILDSEGLKDHNAILIEDTKGGWWINSAVPEPAEVAIFFGLAALALAYWKRSK